MSLDGMDSLREFIDASPTSWQAVDSMAARLDAAGALRLRESEAWELEPGRSYYIVRGGSALLAFRPGLRPPAEEGYAIAGAHTDSPALQVRMEKRLDSRGMGRCAVEVYGGPILSTWLDRPLSLAGRVAVREAGGVVQRLVNLARPVGIVPNLAIHLARDINKGLEYNAQTQLPVLLTAGPPAARGPVALPAAGAGSSAVLALVAAELDLDPSAILGADLFFVDAQRSCLVGPDLLSGPRLDDLLGCDAILEAFIASAPLPQTQVAAFFDAEEIGSRTATGADSSLLGGLLERLSALRGHDAEGHARAIATSFLVSVDVAQAWNPGWPEKYDEDLSPLLNGGPVVKANANRRYATDALSEARFRAFCAEAGVPCQKYMTRADMVPGSTIGPFASALAGLATVDVGSPLLSMHSIRETAGVRDHAMMVAALGRHFATSPVG